MPTDSWEDLLTLADKEGGGFEPVPAGEYNCVITQADAGKTKAGDKDQIKTRAKILDEGPGKNRLIFHDFTITRDNPKAMAIFFRQMGVLGLDRDFFKTHAGVDPIADNLVGKVFKGKVKIKTFNGKETNEFENISTASDDAKAAALNSGTDNPTAPPVGAPPAAPAASAPAPPPAGAPPVAPPPPAAAPPAAAGGLPTLPPPPQF